MGLAVGDIRGFLVVQILYHGKVSKMYPSHIKQYLFLKGGKKKKTVGTTKQVCRRGIRTKYGYIAQIHISMCRWVFVGATGRVRLGRVDQGGKEMELSSRLDLKTINVASLYGRTNLYQSTYLDFKYRDGKVLEH